jgi:arylsulfatase A-like enzyme
MAKTRGLNILWLSFEDTSPRFGCYGDEVARTPNVDRLAREGGRWPNTFSTAPVCAPARSAIITGMYPTFIGSHHMRTTHTHAGVDEMPTPYGCCPPHYVKCFPEYLRAAGYWCTNNYKCDYQFAAPLTAWDQNGAEGHWRNRPDPAQPFFAVWNLQPTHESGQWPEKGGEPETDPSSVTLPPYLPDTLAGRKALARQYDHIAGNDRRVGEILAELEEDGLAEETAVFIWSDHGEGLPRSKRWPYDTGIRVPMIVKWPGGIEPGTVSTALVSTLDLGPTVLSMCGLEVPAHMQGQAFLGAAKAEPREYIYATRDRYDEAYDMVRAVRDGRWKYVRNYRPELPRLLWIPYRNRHPILEDLWRGELAGTLEGRERLLMAESRPVEELYDTEADPWELENLAGEERHAGELARLREAMDAWRARFDRYGDVDERQMVRTWWCGDEQPEAASPHFVPITADSPGREIADAGGTFAGPMLLQLHTSVQGASMGWTMEEGEGARWNLYTGPIRLGAGRHAVRAKAVRIGWAESAERRAVFEVTGRRERR